MKICCITSVIIVKMCHCPTTVLSDECTYIHYVVYTVHIHIKVICFVFVWVITTDVKSLLISDRTCAWELFSNLMQAFNIGYRLLSAYVIVLRKTKQMTLKCFFFNYCYLFIRTRPSSARGRGDCYDKCSAGC